MPPLISVPRRGEHKRRDAVVKAAATTIPLSSPVSKTTSTSRSHRGDIATLSADESKRSCQVEMPVLNARRRLYLSRPGNFEPEITAEIRLDPAAPPPDGRYRLGPVSLRFGVEHSVRLCFGGGDALAATSSRTIIWTVIGMIARICASCITAPTLRLSSWFRGSPSPSSRPSSPSGISTTVLPVVPCCCCVPSRALVPTTYAATRAALSPLHPVSATPLGRLAA